MALLPACREPAHISVKLEMACQDQMLQQCTAMQLDCANYIEVRVYESNGDQLGNILGSNCIPIASFSPRPNTLCDLQANKNSLLGQLPEGKSVVFRLRALTVLDSSDNIIFNDGDTTVALLGVHNLIVVRTGDAILICHRHQAEKIKNLVGKLPLELR